AGCTELRIGSLDPTRDLTFVSDTAAGILALGASDPAVGETVNLGTGTTISVGDLAKACMRIVAREVPIVTDAGRVRPAKSEVMALISDNRKAAALGGWRPIVDLEGGLRRTAEYIAAHLEQYRVQEYQV
ncbi:MAG: GDP-mannose 4,6-dehydratase, partial [Verrucomicrobia bacterium]|nr:GDP-mannose 4,6-dehydratase [Verrucomicrobiota bacterium]